MLQVATSKGEKPTCADDTRPGTTYGEVRLPNLKVESVLRSQQPRDKNDITIITQCSLDRSAYCRSPLELTPSVEWAAVTSVEPMQCELIDSLLQRTHCAAIFTTSSL